MFRLAIFKNESEPVKLRERYHGSDSLPLKVSIRAAWHMIKLYWGSKDSAYAWFLLSLIVILTSGAIYLATAINKWYKDFWDTMQNYDLDGFKTQLLLFVILATIHVLISVYNTFLRSKLVIVWRKWFTASVLHDYLNSDTYYKIQLLDSKTENPDQRIADDLGMFVTKTISLIIGTATDFATLITFGVVLWDLSNAVTMTLWNGYELHLPDGYMLYLAFIYAVLGTIFTFLIGKPLVKLDFRQQRYEADFRFSLIRLRENSESIALYKGNNTEEQILNLSFVNIIKNYISLIRREKILGFFTLGYLQTAVVFPIIIAAPMYFAKIITIGSVMQISSAFGRVQEALSTFVQSFSSWASYKAVIDRLALFFDSMDASEDIKCLVPEENQEKVFAVKNLVVSSPDGQVLWQDLDFSLKLQQSLLIRGPSGCGKSTLIKTCAGIWPYAKGHISHDKTFTTLFLSQRPYLPIGTLREAISYPGQLRGDEEIMPLLEKLSLSKLGDSLDRRDNWSAMLSLGEQQRIAVIRALLIKPTLLFMDEASSALDERLENVAYGLIKEYLSSSVLISVGHRSTLIKMHDLVLHPDKDKAYTIEDSSQYLRLHENIDDLG